MKRNDVLRATLLLILGNCFCFSCSNDLVEPADQPMAPDNVDYLAIIESLGFDALSAIDLGDFFLVEEDIRFDKSSLNAHATEVSSRQARTDYTVSVHHRSELTVKVDNEVPQAWQTAIDGAIRIWSETEGIYLKRITTGTADITVSMFSYYSNYVAAASFPLASGKPGQTISINRYYEEPMNDSQRLYNAVHEFGHCLGFRHTNWRGLGETTAITIPGTPNLTNDPDPNSVMNGMTARNSWNGFSNYDRIAINELYPPLFYNIIHLKTTYSKTHNNVSAYIVFEEAVQAKLKISYVNSAYYTDPGKVLNFSASFGNILIHSGVPGTIEKTVVLSPGAYDLSAACYQAVINHIGGHVSVDITISDVVKTSTGEVVFTTPKGVYLGFGLETVDPLDPGTHI